MAEFELGLVGSGVAATALAAKLASVTRLARQEEIDGNKVVKFIASLQRPRVVLLVLPSGNAGDGSSSSSSSSSYGEQLPPDDSVASLLPHLEAGDVLVHVADKEPLLLHPSTNRRGVQWSSSMMESKGILLLDLGVSGGACFMVGGDKRAYELLEPFLTKCAARLCVDTKKTKGKQEEEDGEEDEDDDDENEGGKGKEDRGLSVSNVGALGAGHFLHMVTRGLESALLQLISELVDVLKTNAAMNNAEVAATLAEWSSISNSELESLHLLELTSLVLTREVAADEEDGGAASWKREKECPVPTLPSYLLDKVLDQEPSTCTSDGDGSVGTQHAIHEASRRGVAIPTITSSLDARLLSSLKHERVAASRVLRGPHEIPHVERHQIVEDAKNALAASITCAFAQGLCLIQSGSDAHGLNIDVAEILRVWQGASVIRAVTLMEMMRTCFSSAAAAPPPAAGGGGGGGERSGSHCRIKNIITIAPFAASLVRKSNSWRRIATLALASGLPCPSLLASLTYFDTYRRNFLPSVALQHALRDALDATGFVEEAKEQQEGGGEVAFCAWRKRRAVPEKDDEDED